MPYILQMVMADVYPFDSSSDMKHTSCSIKTIKWFVPSEVMEKFMLFDIFSLLFMDANLCDWLLISNK